MTTHCAATKPNGEPCQARPLPGHDRCLFHDPAHLDSLAASRSKGGAAPRRRVRRVPRLMDHLHIAEVLGELLIDALNRPDEVDTQRLQVLTRACSLLLRAVGVPKGAHFAHPDHREPSPTADHLLRVYPPLPPEIEALLAAEPPAAPPAPQDDAPPVPASTTHEWQLPGPVDHSSPPPHPREPAPLFRRAMQEERQDPEQDTDRTWTGLSPSTHLPVSLGPADSHPLIPISSRLLNAGYPTVSAQPLPSVPPSLTRATARVSAAARSPAHRA